MVIQAITLLPRQNSVTNLIKNCDDAGSVKEVFDTSVVFRVVVVRGLSRPDRSSSSGDLGIGFRSKLKVLPGHE